jgi:uncharacterized protein YcbK (DUF882 family)
VGDLSMHFSRNEFKCRCGCGGALVNQGLVYLLEAVREHFNSPVIISSGYRCPKHNREVKGAVSSQHLYGNAADIEVQGIKSNTVYLYCDKLNLLGGVGNYDSSNFTHVDVRSSKARW